MQRINFLFYGGFFSVDFFLSAREGKNMEEVYCNFHIVQKKAKKEASKLQKVFLLGRMNARIISVLFFYNLGNF